MSDLPAVARKGKVPILSELREPPIIGRFYMVPYLQSYFYCGIIRDWPVLGPKHNDAEFFNFEDDHYHVDLRFVPDGITSRLERYSPNHTATLEQVVASYPLAATHMPIPNGRPDLKRMRCTSNKWVYPFGRRAQILAIRKKYGNPAEPIRRPDGKLLCPHRKVDLSQFTPDDDGCVTCPLHGLRVRVKA